MLIKLLLSCIDIADIINTVTGHLQKWIESNALAMLSTITSSLTPLVKAQKKFPLRNNEKVTQN